MSKTGKIIGGALSIWPILYFGIFTQMVLPTIVSEGTEAAHFWTFVLLHMFTALLSFILFIYYLFKVIKNDKLGDQKTGWLLGMIFLAPMTWPVYWYFNIWKKNV